MFPCRNRAVGVVVFVVLTLLGQRAAFAQGQEMSVGVRAGVNISTIEFLATDVIITDSNRTGFLAGIYASGRLAGGLGLQVEGLFNQKGTIIRDDPRFEDDIDIRIDYLDVPVLLKYRFGWSATKAFEVHAGPVFMVRLNDRPEDRLDGPRRLREAGADHHRRRGSRSAARCRSTGSSSTSATSGDRRISTMTSTATNWRPGTGH